MEAGRHAGDVAVRLGALVQLGVQVGNDLAELGQALDLAPLPDAVNALLGQLRDAGGLAVRLEGVLLDLRARVRQLAQQALVAHDAHIFAHIARARRDLHQLEQVRAAARLVIIAHAREHIEHRDRVDALRAVEHGVNGLKDALVLVRIKVVRAHLLDDLGDAVRVDQHRTEQRLLRRQILRHLPHQKFVQNHTALSGMEN